jgi:hypothetical protein
MNTNTTHSTRITRRLGLASFTIGTTALLLLASACGTENAAGQAPGSISGPTATSTERQSPVEQAECLLYQTKSGVPCPEQSQPAEADPPQFLAPSGRPIPLPGQAD